MDAIKGHLVPGKGTYVFRYEVQIIEGWERVVGTLFTCGIDVYVSLMSVLCCRESPGGSLKGMMRWGFSLSFSEYLMFWESYGPEATMEERFSEYICRGWPVRDGPDVRFQTRPGVNDGLWNP